MASEEFDLKRVVVVDDDGPKLRTHVRVLDAHGFRPVPFDDPRDALEEILARVPGILVTDMWMPSMTGLELVTRLRTELGRVCPPIILVSTDLDRLAPMEQIMFDALFSNPYSVDAFMECVRGLARCHHERRKAASASLIKRGVRVPRDDEGSS